MLTHAHTHTLVVGILIGGPINKKLYECNHRNCRMHKWYTHTHSQHITTYVRALFGLRESTKIVICLYAPNMRRGGRKNIRTTSERGVVSLSRSQMHLYGLSPTIWFVCVLCAVCELCVGVVHVHGSTLGRNYARQSRT